MFLFYVSFFCLLSDVIRPWQWLYVEHVCAFSQWERWGLLLIYYFSFFLPFLTFSWLDYSPVFRTISFSLQDVISIFCSLVESVWMLFIRDALLVGLVTLGATYAVYRTGKFIYVKRKVRIF